MLSLFKVKEFPHAFDSVTDFSYLYKTTWVVGIDEILGMKAHKRTDRPRHHRKGPGSMARHRQRSEKRVELMKAFNRTKYKYSPKTKKEDRAQIVEDPVA